MPDMAKLAQESRQALLYAGNRASKIFGFPINIDLLMIRCNGDSRFAAGLLSGFRDTGAEAINELRTHVASRDYFAVIESARVLAGTATMLETETLKQLASSLEAAARNGDSNQLARLAHELGNEFQRCLGFSSAFLDALRECDHAE